ncbi:SIR2 family protein [Arthrobacter sp. NPDC055138]
MVAPDMPFFSQAKTRRALAELVTGSSLTIYCGAGVTIGHTGLGWKALIAEIAKEDSTPRRRGSSAKTRRDDAINQIYRSGEIAPEHFASMVIEHIKSEKSFDDIDLDAFIANKLANALYKKHRWNKGTIVGNITQLAVYVAMTGIPVRILTTNYDTHIEKSFEKFISFLQETDAEEGSTFSPAWPGLKWRSIGEDAISQELHAARNVTENIEITYLHGRVAEDGRINGHIVLTEGDYAQTAETVLEELKTQLSRPGDRLMVVGSSLTDPPLVRALALTKSNENFRCALVPLSDDLTSHSDSATQRKLTQIIDQRGAHLGTTILHPETYGQVAQFCEETSICFFHDRLIDRPGSYAKKATGVRYGQRLAYWWPEWSKHLKKADYSGHYRIMRNGLEIVRTFLPALSDPESFRLELWVRRDADLDDRTITLWASSMGPIVERAFLRSERVAPGSTNASVRALRSGKPVLLSIDELGLTKSASRWQTFLSIPIFVQIHPRGRLGGDAPVGVITLASSAQKKASSLSNCPAAELQDLITYLIAEGRKILSIQ